MMQPFKRLVAQAVSLTVDNVDTDQIFPKQFLATVSKQGLGDCLFHDWRFDEQGEARPSFILNHPGFATANILISGRNFGCGSSREHAPWALSDFGIRCIIAASFGDIFHNNCFESGILPIILDEARLTILAAYADAPDNVVDVDLEACVIRVATLGLAYPFDVLPSKRAKLLAGLNSVGETLQLSDQIAAFEANHPRLNEGFGKPIRS